MRILVSSTPGMGHLNALAPVMSALQRAGHDVLVVTAAEACPMVERYGFAVRPGGLGAGQRREAFAPRMPEVLALPPRERRALFFSGFFADAAAPAMRPDLAPVFDEFRPDVAIHEIGELAMAPIATARGVPHVTVAFSGALPPAADRMAIDSITPLWAAEGLPAPTMDDIFGSIYLHPFPPSFGQVPSSASVRPMRAEGRTSEHDEPPPWLGGLGVDRPLVYLTFGTEPIGEMAPWAAAIEAVGSRDVDVVATIGPHVDESLLGPIPPNVRVERFVPQHLILERAAVVVSHAGAGSMLGAAARGLPQLLTPIRADQWENADAATDAGVAITCELDQRSATHIGDALDRLLHDAAITQAAARVSAEIEGMPGPADRVATIEALVDR